MLKPNACVLVLGFFGVVATASADRVTADTGQFTLLTTPPPSVTGTSGLANDTTAYGFFENSVILNTALNVDAKGAGLYTMTAQLTGGTIAAGTAVQSFFLTAQVATFPASGYRSYTGSITFDAPILGVEVVTTSLNNTDSLLGAPGTVYPAPSDTNSGLELNTPGCQQGPPAATQCGDDEFSISADGHTLGFFMSTGQSEDQMRVILGVVKTPEPGSIGLAFLGLLLVAIPVAKQYRGRKSLRREA